MNMTAQQPMDKEQLDATWSLVFNQAKATLMLLPLEKLLALKAAADRADALGPIIDPTAWMEMDREKVRRNLRVLDATIAYVRVMDEIRREELQRAARN